LRKSGPSHHIFAQLLGDSSAKCHDGVVMDDHVRQGGFSFGPQPAVESSVNVGQQASPLSKLSRKTSLDRPDQRRALTYGFKMFRADLVQRLPFTGVRHEFACEGTLLPIRLGLPVAETHSRWVRRKTGRSSNAFIDNLRYVGMALRIRFGTYELLALPVHVEPKILDPSDTSAVGRDNQR
jgi:hypothetical protein